MKLILTLFISTLGLAKAYSSESAQVNKCRQLAIETNSFIGGSLNIERAQTLEADKIPYTQDEFNLLPASEQIAIYESLVPLSNVIEETIDQLSTYINSLMSSYYAALYIDQIARLREVRGNLRSCLEIVQ